MANVVAANVLAATRPSDLVSGHVCNVASGDRLSLRQLLALIEEVTGRPVRWRAAAARVGDVRHSEAGLDRARQLLGYEPCVSLRDGLRATWDWFNTRAASGVAAQGLAFAGTLGSTAGR